MQPWVAGKAPLRTRSGGAEASEQLLAFSRGLYPILLRADAAAFSSYLSRWEDVIGDTSELSATPPDQLRRTMAALLPAPAAVRPARLAGDARPGAGSAGDARPLAGQGPAAVSPGARRGALGSAPCPGAGAPAEPPPAVPRRGTYQVDMLTGELVPVARGAPGGVAEPPPAPYVAADEAQPPPAGGAPAARPGG